MDFIWLILGSLFGSDSKKKKEEDSKIALYSAILNNKNKKK